MTSAEVVINCPEICVYNRVYIYICIYTGIRTNVHLPSVICNLNMPHHDASNEMLHNILFHIMRDHAVPYHIRSYLLVSCRIISCHIRASFHVTQQVHVFHFSILSFLTRISRETSHHLGPFRLLILSLDVI